MRLHTAHTPKRSVKTRRLDRLYDRAPFDADDRKRKVFICVKCGRDVPLPGDTEHIVRP